jgi:hypothetical protein
MDAAGWQAACAAIDRACAVNPLDPAPPDGEEVRRRCRAVVLLQRTVESLLRRAEGAAPAAAQLRLLATLQGTVERAAQTNADSSRREALLAAVRPQSGGSGNGGGEGLAAVAAAAVPGTADDVLPALIRQEAEGGCLLLGALQRAVAAASDHDDDCALRAECESRLAAYSLAVTGAAAMRASAAPSASWEDALRAPLVEAALQALAALPGDAWHHQRAAAVTHASRLVMSQSILVKRAVAALMMKQASVKLAPGKQQQAFS